MKQTSIQANIKAEAFKGTHGQKIMLALVRPMTGREIAVRTSLNYHAVMRRMSELERTDRVIPYGTKDGMTIYKVSQPANIMDPQTELF